MVCSGPVERMALRVLKADRVPMENLAPLVLPERRVNWVSLDCLVILEDKDPRAQAVSPGSLEPMARKEPGVSLANLAPGGKEVPQVLVVVEEPEVRQENPVLRAHQAMTALQDRPVREGLKDHRDQLVSLDQRAPMDHLERMGCPDILVSVERRVSKEKLAHQALEVS